MDEQRKEWDESEEVNLPQEAWDKVWSSIERRRKSYGKVLLVKGMAVAASVAILILAGIRLLDKTENSGQALAKAKAEVPAPEQKLMINTTQKAITVYLPDSSEVLLSPAATVKYYVPFRDNKRDFYLEGEARFAVKKDKTMPFTVYAGELATTALGTEFTVTNSGADNINIQLHSGKVVVRRSGTVVTSWKKDVYLVPGEQLNYNTVNMTASISLIHEAQSPAQLVAERKQKKPQLKELHDKELTFMNSPLAEVIGRLEKQFKVSIVCDSADIAKANFTGTFNRSDSLNIILKIISQMNDLEMQEDNGDYVLKKVKTQ